MDPMQVFPAGRCLRRRRGKWQYQFLRPVELPRLARQKGCFAAYDIRSIDQLSGHTTGRLGYIRPSHWRNSKADTKTLHYLRIYRRTKLLQVATTGRTGLLERWHHCSIGWGSRTFSGTTGRAIAADAAGDSAGAAVP